MLAVEEFTCGSLNDAEPLALVLPRTKHEEPILVGGTGQKRVAVFIGEKHSFHSFGYDVGGNDHWSGLIIKGVAIEVDESTVFDPNLGGSPLGALVRQDTRLFVRAITDGHFDRGHTVTSLIEGLETVQARHPAAFLRWQIVIGKGIEKRVLRTIDVRPGT